MELWTGCFSHRVKIRFGKLVNAFFFTGRWDTDHRWSQALEMKLFSEEMGWGGTLLPHNKFMFSCALESERLDVFIEEGEVWQISVMQPSTEFHLPLSRWIQRWNFFLSWRTIIECGKKIIKELIRKDFTAWSYEEKHLENTGIL